MISRYPIQPTNKDDIIELNTMYDDDDMPVNYQLIAERQAADP